jgi:cytochrome c oxidase cbb3-type subunit 3
MNKPNPPEEESMLDHEVDGIRELDNLLPRWWVWLFYGTIIYAGIYMAYFHVFKLGETQAAEFAREWKQGEEIKSASIAAFEGTIQTLEPSKDSAVLGKGRQIFTTLCSPCHRADGGGLVGPNLCDDYWIHGSNYVDNLRTIINGVPEKGMLTWRGVLKPSEIQSVASYIYTLRGSKPPNPKPREDQAGPEKPNVYE